MQDIPSGAADAAEAFPDIEECFRPVCVKYGREMFAFLMNVGLGKSAAEVLGQYAPKLHSQHFDKATVALISAFNQITNSYVGKTGWTQGELAQCDRDIQLAYSGKLIVPKGSPIILNG